MIRRAVPGDAGQISGLYNYYIENTTITFEEEPVSSFEMEKRIRSITEKLPWFVFCKGEELTGYAYASPWRVRPAYRYSVETTVYVKNGCTGEGTGRELYTALLDELKDLGYHLAIAGIALPNEPSRLIHEKMGFKKAAHFREVGFKFGTWLDVGYWEKHLEGI